MKKKKNEEDILGDPDEEDEEEEMMEGEVESEDEEESQNDFKEKFEEIDKRYLKLANVVSIQTKWIKKHTEQLAKIDDNFKLLLQQQ